MSQHHQGNVCVFLQSTTLSSASTLSLKTTDIFRDKFFLPAHISTLRIFICVRENIIMFNCCNHKHIK